MYKTFITNKFSIAILLSLTLASLVFISLLWNRFDNLTTLESQHILHQNSLILIKDIRFDIVQIQQYLTDVSLTRSEEGFQFAAHHLQSATTGLDTLSELKPALQLQAAQLREKVILTYEVGVRMASNYLNNDLDFGKAAMIQLDANSEALTEDLSRIALQLEQALQQSVLNNHQAIERNQVILMFAVPIVLGFFCGLLLKASRLLKRQMNWLQYRTTQLNTVLDTVGSSIITIDKTGHILSFNQAAERIFGYSLHEIVGKNVSCLMPQAVGAHHDDYLQRYLNTEQATILGKRREVEAVRKNGEIFPASLRVNLMQIDGDLFFSGVIDDISETKTLQSQLIQAQKLEAIGQLASGVAHEINTPIQYIGDNLAALKDNFADLLAYQHEVQALTDEPALKQQFGALVDKYDLAFILEDSPKAIQQSLQGVERVVEIVKSMKTLSHVETSRGKQAVNLHEALGSALIVTRNTYKNIANVETDFSPEISVIEGYPNELNQVFLNLLINATHAIDEKMAGAGLGLIRVVTRKLEGQVEIMIQDNGAGIPLEIQEKVFNLFFTTKEVGKGTGQGLSLAHSIVTEKHHGKLFLESVPGVGTTFHIQLPIKQED